MESPSLLALSIAKDESAAADGLDLFDKSFGERLPLKIGDRVFLLTVEGEYPGTVVERDWSPTTPPSALVAVALDCRPETPLAFNRALFRSFTVLDHIARV